MTQFHSFPNMAPWKFRQALPSPTGCQVQKNGREERGAVSWDDPVEDIILTHERSMAEKAPAMSPGDGSRRSGVGSLAGTGSVQKTETKKTEEQTCVKQISA